jgi:TusA-related sulfurtransferase
LHGKEVLSNGIENDKPDVSADLSGKTCPYTVMGVSDALKTLDKGQML